MHAACLTVRDNVVNVMQTALLLLFIKNLDKKEVQMRVYVRTLTYVHRDKISNYSLLAEIIDISLCPIAYVVLCV